MDLARRGFAISPRVGWLGRCSSTVAEFDDLCVELVDSHEPALSHPEIQRVHRSMSSPFWYRSPRPSSSTTIEVSVGVPAGMPMCSAGIVLPSASAIASVRRGGSSVRLRGTRRRSTSASGRCGVSISMASGGGRRRERPCRPWGSWRPWVRTSWRSAWRRSTSTRSDRSVRRRFVRSGRSCSRSFVSALRVVGLLEVSDVFVDAIEPAVPDVSVLLGPVGDLDERGGSIVHGRDWLVGLV